MLRFAWSMDLAKKVGEALAKTSVAANQPRTTAKEATPAPGRRVRHATFGVGTLKDTGVDAGGQPFAVVEFGNLLTMEKTVPLSSLTLLD
jgi:hypothetical protein